LLDVSAGPNKHDATIRGLFSQLLGDGNPGKKMAA
jgi:hypothetical protein